MELPLESINSFQPTTGTLDQWNAAFVRVEDYLRAHRIQNRLHQSRLLQRILIAAAQEHEKNPAADPVTLSVEQAERMMDAWFGDLLDEKERPHERIAAEGRVALLLSDATQRWPYAFLEENNTPSDFKDAMKRSSIQAGPDLAISNMVPREIDLGIISEAAGEVLRRMDKLPILRAILLWGIFLATLTAVFLATR